MKSITLLSLLVVALQGGGDDDKQPLELRLRSAVSVRGLEVRISDLCEIPADAPNALALAGLRFAAAPQFGHARTVTRLDVVQALAAAGVPLASVKLVGADEASVQTAALEIPPTEMLDAATASLQALLALEGGDVEFEPPSNVRRVQAPPGREGQSLRARVRDAHTGPSMAVVDVEVLVDGVCYQRVPLTFRLQRFHQVLKTIGVIAKGTPLGPDNLQVVRQPMAQFTGQFLDRTEQVLGMLASRNLQGNQMLTLGDIVPPAAVHQGDLVTVVITRGNIKVVAKAMANHDAPLEGRVTLTNLSTRGLLSGIVHAPGLVVVP